MIKKIKRNRVINSIFEKLELEEYVNNPTWFCLDNSILSIYPNQKKCYFYIDDFYEIIQSLNVKYRFQNEEIIELIKYRFNLTDYEIIVTKNG